MLLYLYFKKTLLLLLLLYFTKSDIEMLVISAQMQEWTVISQDKNDNLACALEIYGTDSYLKWWD